MTKTSRKQALRALNERTRDLARARAIIWCLVKDRGGEVKLSLDDYAAMPLDARVHTVLDEKDRCLVLEAREG